MSDYITPDEADEATKLVQDFNTAMDTHLAQVKELLVNNTQLHKDLAMAQERVMAALQIAVEYGQCDGTFHKAWAIDQMCRTLLANSDFTNSLSIFAPESDAYKAFITDARAGDDGPETYDWDIGIAP